MTLWLLKLREDRDATQWHPKSVPFGSNRFLEYGDTAGFVVRAASEEGARKVASEDSEYGARAIWLDPEWTICERIESDGPEVVILSDQPTG